MREYFWIPPKPILRLFNMCLTFLLSWTCSCTWTFPTDCNRLSSSFSNNKAPRDLGGEDGKDQRLLIEGRRTSPSSGWAESFSGTSENPSEHFILLRLNLHLLLLILHLFFLCFFLIFLLFLLLLFPFWIGCLMLFLLLFIFLLFVKVISYQRKKSIQKQKSKVNG